MQINEIRQTRESNQTVNYESLLKILDEFEKGESTSEGYVNPKFTPMPEKWQNKIFSLLLSDRTIANAVVFERDGKLFFASWDAELNIISPEKVFAWKEIKNSTQ